MKNMIITLDTETADLTGNVYDFGYIVHDRNGAAVVERNWLVEEIFTDANIITIIGK